MARLLCGAFIGIAAIVTLNLLIALLSNTFERLYENAVENAVMQRARTILLLQKSLRRKQKLKYYGFIKKKGSPEVIRNDLGRLLSTETDDNASLEQVHEDIRFIMKVLGERFGKKYGKGKKSDMDFVKMDLSKVRRFQEELVVDVRNMKLMIQGITEMIETLQTKNNATPYHVVNDGEKNDENMNNNQNNNTNNNINNDNKTESSLATPKIFTIPYSLGDNKKIQRVQKKTKNSKVSSSDSDSETSSTSSQDSSDENDHKSKKNQKRNKNKKKRGYKDRKETDSDGSKHDKTGRLPYPRPSMTNPMQDFRQNNDNVYPPISRLPTSASYPEMQQVHDHIPLISHGYSAIPARSPYLSSNRGIFNPAITSPSPYDSPLSGQDRRFALQIQQRQNGFTNYGFQPENQDVHNQPATNVQYYANVPPQTLHVHRTKLPKSLSDTAIHGSTQHNQQPHAYQPEVRNMTSYVSPHMTGFQPENEVFHEPSPVNSFSLGERNHDLSLPIPRASVPSDQQSHSISSQVTRGQTNPMIYSPDNSSEI